MILKDKWVDVCMSRNDCFPFQTAVHFIAKVLYVPNDVGDSYTLQLKDGTILTLNPNSCEYCGMVVGDEEIQKEMEGNL